MAALSIAFTEVEGLMGETIQPIIEVAGFVDDNQIRGIVVGRSGEVSLRSMFSLFSSQIDPAFNPETAPPGHKTFQERAQKLTELVRALQSLGVERVRLHSTKPIVEQLTGLFALPDPDVRQPSRRSGAQFDAGQGLGL